MFSFDFTFGKNSLIHIMQYFKVELNWWSILEQILKFQEGGKFRIDQGTLA